MQAEPSEITTIVAWIGALTGVGRLLWDIVKWKASGPRVKMKVLPHRKIYGSTDPGDQGIFIFAEVRNVGTAKTTLQALDMVPSHPFLRNGAENMDRVTLWSIQDPIILVFLMC